MSNLIGPHRRAIGNFAMWNNVEFLKLCESLKSAGRPGKFGSGTRISRGFADVGFEEFVILPNGKTMSLFTGAQSEFLDEHKGFFFEVPTVEDFLVELEIRGERIVAVEFIDQREWRVQTTSLKGASRELQEALAGCLLQSYQGSLNQ